MFLLNLGGIAKRYPFHIPLHPIMFLLNLLSLFDISFVILVFTSHYVPIKSLNHYLAIYKVEPLHPIMFLLNRNVAILSFVKKSRIFTSHYVPIKSKRFAVTLFVITVFTSHYVPIKSNLLNEFLFSSQYFTSHYVPIKSKKTFSGNKKI